LQGGVRITNFVCIYSPLEHIMYHSELVHKFVYTVFRMEMLNLNLPFLYMSFILCKLVSRDTRDNFRLLSLNIKRIIDNAL
jgi:hypothetical protein